MQMSYLYASDFPFKNFCKIAQHTETIRKKCLGKAYSLSIRVQTTINHILTFTFLCFLRPYQRQRKCLLSERELNKVLRDTLTRAAWLGPSNFLLVRSEHSHASYPGLFFRPGSTRGGKKGEFRDWTRVFFKYPKISTNGNPLFFPVDLCNLWGNGG